MVLEITTFDRVLKYHEKLIFELYRCYHEGTLEERRVSGEIIRKALDNEVNRIKEILERSIITLIDSQKEKKEMWNNKIEVFKDRMQKLGSYFLEEDTINQLCDSFSKLYPKLYSELEKIRTDIQLGIVERRKRFYSSAEWFYKKQEICGKMQHAYIKTDRDITNPDEKTNKLKKKITICKRCLYVKQEKKDPLIP